MITLDGDTLNFRFTDVHPDAELRIDLQRTLRIPDDGRSYPLPPGFGSFPLRHIEDIAATVPGPWLQRGGVILPMYQAEALWVNFSARSGYPFAVKIGTGKINAVSGEIWTAGLNRDPQDYVVAPDQPWLDGYCVEKGKIRQFVAAPLGKGYTAEEQITGEADVGGLQIQVWPMKANAYRDLLRRQLLGRQRIVFQPQPPVSRSLSIARSRRPMGLAPGGAMQQEIHDDPHDLEVWDQRRTDRCFLTIANSKQWMALTGESLPSAPVSVEAYVDAGLPWFDYFDDDAEAIEATAALKGLKSIKEIGDGKVGPLAADASLDAAMPVRSIGPNRRIVTAGEW